MPKIKSHVYIKLKCKFRRTLDVICLAVIYLFYLLDITVVTLKARVFSAFDYSENDINIHGCHILQYRSHYEIFKQCGQYSTLVMSKHHITGQPEHGL